MSKKAKELRKLAADFIKDRPDMPEVAEDLEREAEILDQKPDITDEQRGLIKSFLLDLRLPYDEIYPHNLYDRDELESLKARFDAEGLSKFLSKEYAQLEESDRKLKTRVREDVLDSSSAEWAVYSGKGFSWYQDGHPDKRPNAWWYSPLDHGLVTADEIAEKYKVDKAIVEEMAKAKMRTFEVYVINLEDRLVNGLVYANNGFFTKKVAFSASDFEEASAMNLYRCLEIQYEDGRIQRKFERSHRNLIPEEAVSIRACLNEKSQPPK